MLPVSSGRYCIYMLKFAKDVTNNFQNKITKFFWQASEERHCRFAPQLYPKGQVP